MTYLLRRIVNVARFLSLIAYLGGVQCFPAARVLISHKDYSNRLKKSSNYRRVLDSSKRTIHVKNIRDQTIICPKQTEPSSSIDLIELEKVPSTLSGALHRFFFGKDYAPILALTAIFYFIFNRISLHSTGYSIQVIDVCILFGSIIFWWFQEHFMHGNLLHSQMDWMGKQIHNEHHKKPYFHISIDSPELVLGWLFTVHLILRLVLPLPLAISATIGYSSAGLFYEWAHYIVHTRVKPKGRFFRKMRDHHIRHHLVNEKYWLGFSIPEIDDLFGTNPPLEKARKVAKAP